MAEDFRIRIVVGEEEHAAGFLERIGVGVTGEAAELAEELKNKRLAVSRDGNEIFVYADSPQAADTARAVVEAELRAHDVQAETGPVERWLDDEDRWSGEPVDETWEQEEVDRGFAPWEVRVELRSPAEAKELAERLEAEGFGVERWSHFVLAGCSTREQAEELAKRLHGQVEAGGEVVWESGGSNPFAVFGSLFGGLGREGTPL